jgi:SAM-dependent methyltransferase
MFSNHTYISGSTATLRNHFKETAGIIDGLLLAESTSRTCLDIGSNDGSQLLQYQNLGYNVLGVESSDNVAQIARDTGVPTVTDYFNLQCAQTIDRQFHVINASGIFFHLEELHSAAEGVRLCLRKDGLFVVQFLYMKKIVENLAFDQIYHEHLLYYTIKTITTLLNLHGLEPVDAYLSPIHGGSVILMASLKGVRSPSERLLNLIEEEKRAKTNELDFYADFAVNTNQLRTRILEFLDRTRSADKRVYGMGAPVKGNTLLNYCKIGTDYLDLLAEINPLRKGLISPGMHIPILMEDEIDVQPQVYFVLAWNFKNEILAKYRDLILKGIEFYFPINP